MADPATLVLVSGSTTAGAEVEVDVAAGGRLARIDVAGEPLLVEPGTDPTSTAWGCFPMAPWAGRVRQGRFRFDGVEHRLRTNHVDGGYADADGGAGDPQRRHAIHGTVFSRPWEVVHADATSAELTCELTGALDWPFPGIARQRLRLSAAGLSCELSVEPDGGSMPAEVGWHPWFRKPDRLEFAPTAMYRRDRWGLPTGELVPPEAGPWDDCFVAPGPVTLHYDRPAASRVVIRSDCDHWVVFDEPEGATCVEPQSGPPDAFTVRPRPVPPGHPLRRTMSITW